ncbi:MAG: PQQ-binding-like beta-propeller repeat protein [Gammaproteobacteria bacterium]|nr:PQQ-binding-like beta-propeller repeat protein [Gammaproteobacteria bacterium]
MKKVIIILVVIVAAIATFIGYTFGEQLSWRGRVLLLKASGQLDFLSVGETVRWLLPNSPVYLYNLLDGRNPHTALTSARFTDRESLSDARQLYRERCAACHGIAGEGQAGGSPLAYGLTRQSDWSLYQVLTYGAPGTSMQPQQLRDHAAWGLVAYIRTLAATERRLPAGPGTVLRGPSYDRLVDRRSEMDNWLTYSGDYSGSRHSELDEVTVSNVQRLALRWVYQSRTTYDRVQASPIVVDGVMFISEPPGRVVALNAQNGQLIWEFERNIPTDLVLCCGVVNRGVAVLEDLVFVTTIDAHLLALDIRTGALRWQTQVADHRAGYSITAAPLAIDGKVVTGVAGGETATRGFLAAYDTQGTEVWRFDTVPEPGAPGSETWDTSLWEIGGAATWMTGSYDPALDLIYWGTSHTVHEPTRRAAPGSKKLYGSSLLAVRGETGELVWFFQFTPDDIHGFDAAQVPVLFDVERDGVIDHRIITFNRNGFRYVLDRRNGQFISGGPFTEVTWASSLTQDGQPVVDHAFDPSAEGTLSWPSHVGAANWWPPAFDPESHTLCVPVVDGPSVFYTQEVRHRRGQPYVPVVGRQAVTHPWRRFIRCTNSKTGDKIWQHELASAQSFTGEFVMSGLLHTRGGLVFAGDRGDFLALDSRMGEELWRVHGGGNIVAPPISYRADGRQFIAVIAGRALLAFSLPD